MKKHHPLLIGVFLLSSSCKTVTEHLSPDPEEVFPDSTGKFLQADKDSTPQTERIEGDWWKIFKDPQLDQLMQSAQHIQPRRQGCPRTIRPKSCSTRYHTLKDPSHDSWQWERQNPPRLR